MTTDDARATLAALETNRADLSRREIDLATEGKRLSLAALTGDTAAKKALAKLDEEALRLGLEMKHARDAVEAQKAIVAEAQRAEAMAAQRNNAVQATALGESLVRRAKKIDEALAIVSAESNAFLADISALNRLGLSNPRAEQFTSLGERALNTALMNCPLKVRHLGHGERRNFTETATGWRDSIARWASQFLDKAEAA